MPSIEHLVEASVYAENLERAEDFYRDILGLEMLTKEPGRHVFFAVGESVLLIFRAEATLKGGMLPPHGATGAGHFALGIPEMKTWLSGTRTGNRWPSVRDRLMIVLRTDNEQTFLGRRAVTVWYNSP